MQSRVVWAELKRKALHLCGVIIPVLYLLSPKNWIILGFLIGFCIIVLLEWLRFRGRIMLPALREQEHRNIPAYVFFVIGAFLSRRSDDRWDDVLRVDTVRKLKSTRWH